MGTFHFVSLYIAMPKRPIAFRFCNFCAAALMRHFMHFSALMISMPSDLPTFDDVSRRLRHERHFYGGWPAKAS